MLRAAIGNKNFEMIFINCDLKIASNIQALHPAGHLENVVSGTVVD